MVGSKGGMMSNPGMCWADEVEKEEEEELARTHFHQTEKKNPFGFARPREVVLEEKGIDWKKIDLKLHQTSISREARRVKENVPAPTELVGEKRPWSPKTRGLEVNVDSARVHCSESGAPLGCMTIQNQDVEPLVPPLRYPPKNIMVLMKGKQWPDIAYKADDCIVELKDSRTDDETGMQRSLMSKRLETRFEGPLCDNTNLRDRDMEWEKEGLLCLRDGISLAVKGSRHRAMGKMPRGSSSSVRREKEWKNVDPNYNGRRFFRDRGPSVLVNGRRSFDCRNRENEYGIKCGIRESLGGPLLVRQNYENVGVKLVEERISKKMDLVHGRRRYGGRVIEGPWAEGVDLGRAFDHQYMDIAKAGFVRNIARKREVESGSSVTHDHHRSRN